MKLLTASHFTSMLYLTNRVLTELMYTLSLDVYEHHRLADNSPWCMEANNIDLIVRYLCRSNEHDNCSPGVSSCLGTSTDWTLSDIRQFCDGFLRTGIQYVWTLNWGRIHFGEHFPSWEITLLMFRTVPWACSTAYLIGAYRTAKLLELTAPWMIQEFF